MLYFSIFVQINVFLFIVFLHFSIGFPVMRLWRRKILGKMLDLNLCARFELKVLGNTSRDMDFFLHFLGIQKGAKTLVSFVVLKLYG